MLKMVNPNPSQPTAPLNPSTTSAWPVTLLPLLQGSSHSYIAFHVNNHQNDKLFEMFKIFHWGWYMQP